jgi:hypothetical protein
MYVGIAVMNRAVWHICIIVFPDHRSSTASTWLKPVFSGKFLEADLLPLKIPQSGTIQPDLTCLGASTCDEGNFLRNLGMGPREFSRTFGTSCRS